MSKKCPKCKSKDIHITEYPTDDMATCYGCGYADLAERFPEESVFDRITQSPDVLAEKLVYREFITEEDDGYVYRWRSTILPNDFWFDEDKAIVATAEKLKEVKK